MANKIYGLVLLTFAAAGTLSAQQSDVPPALDRQVDVSRDYVPDIQRASKLDVRPNMTDTVALRPEFEYSVQPSPWSTGFGVVAINPARVEVGRDLQRPFYLKAGGGYQGQSLLDFYLTGAGTNASGGVYLNHYGRYNKLRNDLGYEARALETQNSAGVFGKIGLGGRISLLGEVGADYGLWSLYGRAASLQPGPGAYENIKSPLQSHFTPRANIAVGHDFTDLSFLNFRAGAKFYHLDSRNDDSETGIGAFVEAARRFGVHTLSLKLSLDNRHTVRESTAGNDWAGRRTDNTVLGGGFRYAGDFGRLYIGLGLDVAHDNRERDDSKFYLLPQAMLRLDMSGNGSFAPYVSMESRLVDNGYRSLIGYNPYYSWRQGSYNEPGYAYFYNPAMPHNSREFIARGGISGNLSGVFSYNVYAGYGWYLDPAFFYTLHLQRDQSVFDAASFSRMTVFLAGAELEGRISGSFTAGASVRYYDYSPDKDHMNIGGGKFEMSPDYAPGLPEYEGEIYVKYAYRDKFRIRAGVQLTGKRRFFDLYATDIANINNYPPYYGYITLVDTAEQKAVADVSLEAEYFVNPGFGVFLSGHNLADQKLYPYNHYRGHGITIDAGVKLVF